MGKIYLISDSHFNHNKNFIWGSRGYGSVRDMNEVLIARWNMTVNPEDDVYHLGDVMLGDNDEGLACLKRLNGKIHIILGNHDTDVRAELYKTCENVVEVVDAKRLKYGKYHFFLSHYPCDTGNLEEENLKQMTLNLHGHTHQREAIKDKFYQYHVGVDTNGGFPVDIEHIIQEIKAASAAAGAAGRESEEPRTEQFAESKCASCAFVHYCNLPMKFYDSKNCFSYFDVGSTFYD